MMDYVLAQLDAYNARNIDRFMACYTEDVVIENPDGTVSMQGHAAMRERYSAMFEQYPELHCTVVNRIRIGDWAVDEERITGRGSTEQHAVAIYQLAPDGRIARVRFLR
jgi:hypothetical protein